MAVILNPNAGVVHGWSRPDVALAIHRTLAQRFDFRIISAAGPKAAHSAEQAIAEGAQAVVVGGGDGTIGSVARIVADKNVALGVLPLGTCNHFALDLLATRDLNDALGILARGDTRRIDMGEVNGRRFVNNASIGLYPYAIQERVEQQQARRGKRLATFIAAFKTFFRLPLIHARIHVAGRCMERYTPFVFVGNNAYSLQFRREKLRPQLDQGELCVIAARRGGMRCMLRLMFDAWRNRLTQSADLDLWHGTDVTVETRRHNRHVAMDGEVEKMETPLHFCSAPRALRVIAPPAE